MVVNWKFFLWNFHHITIANFVLHYYQEYARCGWPHNQYINVLLIIYTHSKLYLRKLLINRSYFTSSLSLSFSFLFHPFLLSQVSPHHSIYILLVCHIRPHGSGPLVWLAKLHRPCPHVLVLRPAGVRLQATLKLSKVHHHTSAISDVCGDICERGGISSDTPRRRVHILLGYILLCSGHVHIVCDSLYEFLLSAIYQKEAKKVKEGINWVILIHIFLGLQY